MAALAGENQQILSLVFWGGVTESAFFMVKKPVEMTILSTLCVKLGSARYLIISTEVIFMQW